MSTRFLSVLLVVFFCAACGTTSVPVEYQTGDLELRGPSIDNWSDGTPPGLMNFVWDYETKGWRGGEKRPFHRMLTRLSLAYDPVSGEVHSAKVIASESSGAFRHICLSAEGPVLRIRMATLLDDRAVDLTVVDVSGATTASVEEFCANIGVGPKDGLVEGVDVVFHEDGSYRVISATGAYLAGADLRMERTMGASGTPGDTVSEVFPD